MKNDWWTLTPQEVTEKQNTHTKKGLSKAEAAERLRTQGENRLPPPKKASLIMILFTQFNNVIIWILIAAAIIAGFLGEWLDSGVILTITLLNIVMGFVQEWRSTRAMEALTTVLHPTTKVIRDGQLGSCFIEEVVPGDLLLLEAGDAIPADARLIACYGLKTQEAALTGESTGIIKSTSSLPQEYLVPADRNNMVFRGTSVIYGKGHAIVTATGLDTEIGKIAQLTQNSEKAPSPLQEDLEQMGKQLINLSLLVIFTVIGIGFFKGFPFYTTLMLALSLAVAAIPEGLPAVVTIALAIGMQRMAKRNALIRRLAAVETLGSTSVICTDKTGTLTENTMRIRSIWVNRQEIQMTGHGYRPDGQFLQNQLPITITDHPELSLLLRCGVECNSASLEKKEDEWVITGDPTEAALLVAAQQAGVSLDRHTTAELPFDSERKMMSSFISEKQGSLLFVKGAPDVLLPRTSTIFINGTPTPLSEDERQQLLCLIKTRASQGLRMLALAYRQFEDAQIAPSPDLENALTFLGFVAMQDPPRKEAAEVVQQCIRAGIRPMMLTGDHLDTATAIAQELGILRDGQAIEGCELQTLNDEQLQERIPQISVVARIASEHKSRIIDALQRQDEVVAMTGDGVNDAPAIEKADIGVAMGINGTDVTKAASDMVILDDNFCSIVSAVKEGRNVFENIVTFSSYLLSCNLAEILVVFIGMLLFTNSEHATLGVLAPIHLLWINLVTDGMPAIALAFDPLSPTALNKPPRPRSAHLLEQSQLIILILLSVLIATLTLTVFSLTLPLGIAKAQTAAFTTLVILELTKPLLLRKGYHPIFSNRLLWFALLSSLLLQLSILYLPLMQTPLKTTPLGLQEWTWIGIVTCIFIALALPLLQQFRHCSNSVEFE